MEKLNLLVIATGYPAKLLQTIKERGHEYTCAKPGDFDLYLSDSKGHDKVFLFGHRMVASKYDAVISRVGEHREYASAILRQLQHNLGMFCVQSGASIETCANKFKAAQIISEKRLKVPRQFYSLDGRYPAMYVDKLGGLPAILKLLSGSKGKGLILLESPTQTNMTLASFYQNDSKRILLQEFLNNGGTDERHIVCGGKVVNSMRRHAPSNDIRANLSLAGTGEKIEPDEETKQFAISCCEAIPGLNFAGVDVMKVKQGDDEIKYFIEINSNPGEKIIDITGHNHYEDLLDFVEQNYRRKGLGKSNADASLSVIP